MAKSFTSVPGSMTKIRPEQIKSELSLGTLSGDIAALTQSFADVIGAAWDSDLSGYQNVQLTDLAAHLNAEAANAKLEVLKNLDVVGSITGSAALVENLNVAGGIVFADSAGALDNDAALAWNGSALKVTGSISGSGALNAGGAAVLGSTLNVMGTADFDAAVNFDAAVDMKAALKVTGSVSMDSTLYVKAGAELDSTLTVAGAVDFDSSFEVAGATDLKGALMVTGSASMASTLDVLGAISGSSAIYGASLDVDGQVDAATGLFTGDVTMRDLTARTGSFSGDLTVTGNFTVNGTTTTVNSTTLTVDDKNIELGTVATPTDTTADGGGITLKGATDKTIIWVDATDAWTFSESLYPSTSGVKDLGSATSKWNDLHLAGDADIDSTLTVGGIATFTAAITGSAGLEISGGAANFLAGATASSLAISGDVSQRLYIVGGDGSIKDEQNLIYTGAQLNVTGVISGSGQVRGASFQAAGLGDVGSLVVQGQSQLKGLVKLESLAEVSGSVVPSVSSVFDLGSSSKRYREVLANVANLGAESAVQMLSGFDQKIIKGGAAGNLVVTSSVATGFIVFDDAYRGAEVLGAGSFAGLKLANSGEWATFADAYPTVDSILGAFNRIAEGGGAEKGLFKAASGVAAVNSVNITVGDSVGMADMTFSALTKDNSMVFFNGQLLRSGSVADLSGTPSADYSFDEGATSVKFAFAVESGDQLVVQKL